MQTLTKQSDSQTDKWIKAFSFTIGGSKESKVNRVLYIVFNYGPDIHFFAATSYLDHYINETDDYKRPAHIS